MRSRARSASPRAGTWEISRDATQGADLKVGDKVTVDYTMAVKSIQVKPAKK